MFYDCNRIKLEITNRKTSVYFKDSKKMASLFENQAMSSSTLTLKDKYKMFISTDAEIQLTKFNTHS